MITWPLEGTLLQSGLKLSLPVTSSTMWPPPENDLILVGNIGILQLGQVYILGLKQVTLSTNNFFLTTVDFDNFHYGFGLHHNSNKTIKVNYYFYYWYLSYIWLKL